MGRAIFKDKAKLGILLGSILLIFGSVAYILTLNLNPLYYIAALWTLLVVVLIVTGNILISKVLDRKLPWSKYVTWRFFGHLIIAILYSLAIINITYFIIKHLLTDDPPTQTQIMIMNLYGILLTIPLISIYFGVHFLKAWKKSELESEKLQRESMQSQLDTLKNHLDPHFLFNNLNILSALIDDNREASKDFLNKFAEVYRFLLHNKGSELISLSQELDFLRNYITLIKYRFGENVTLEENINFDPEKIFIPPLTLQMLIENGLKHNKINRENCLRFKLHSNGSDYLVLKNNLNKKETNIESHKTGLKNIINRYEHFTDKKVFIEDTGYHFVVKVPVVEIEEL